MIDKKKHKHEHEVTETQPTAESVPVDGNQPNAEVETLKSQLAEAEVQGIRIQGRLGKVASGVPKLQEAHRAR